MGEDEFPARLRRLRERRGVRQYIVSELCGLNRSTIRRYERGEREPGLKELVSIADYFEVSIDYLAGLTENGLTLLEGWARDGLTDEQIAHNMGIAVGTIYDWKKKFPEISEALKKGKEVVDYQVENALLSKALDGDTTAQIFWLKNRRPDKWRDKPVDDKQQTAVEDLTPLAEKLRG